MTELLELCISNDRRWYEYNFKIFYWSFEFFRVEVEYYNQQK